MITIKPLQYNQIDDAAHIIQTVFGQHGDKAKQEFERLFKGEDHPTYVFLAYKNNQVVGIAACLETFFSFNVYGICWIAVLEEHRRQGICKKLFMHIEKFIADELLDGKKGTVILSADSYANYYERLGYKKLPEPIHDQSFLMQKIIN